MPKRAGFIQKPFDRCGLLRVMDPRARKSSPLPDYSGLIRRLAEMVKSILASAIPPGLQPLVPHSHG
jgi:hypothetical protein